ncbi:MAG: hypothetical protein FWD68_00715 [Alphaproteobacteria bacterium]|nr:hypothetical protein [Alphaproteobacteria bacterium]
MDTEYSVYLHHLAVRVPALLICLAGAGAALMYRRRYPRPAMLMLTGMVLLVAATVGGSLIRCYLVESDDWSIDQLGWALGVNTVSWAVIQAMAWGLLLMAVFSNRDNQTSPTRCVQPNQPGVSIESTMGGVECQEA